MSRSSSSLSLSLSTRYWIIGRLQRGNTCLLGAGGGGSVVLEQPQIVGGGRDDEFRTTSKCRPHTTLCARKREGKLEGEGKGGEPCDKWAKFCSCSLVMFVASTLYFYGEKEQPVGQSGTIFWESFEYLCRAQ